MPRSRPHSIYIDDELWDAARERSALKGISTGSVINLALAKYLSPQPAEVMEKLLGADARHAEAISSAALSSESPVQTVKPSRKLSDDDPKEIARRKKLAYGR